jgi:DNA-binding transcriptional regulator YiaG
MTTPTRSTIDRIRAMMERHNMSQSAMGRFLGVGQGNVANWLGGAREPVQAVTRLIEVLELMEAFSPALFKSELAKAVK